ncbi:hypothetical protein ACJX0J_013786, partial [Zea mays]
LRRLSSGSRLGVEEEEGVLERCRDLMPCGLAEYHDESSEREGGEKCDKGKAFPLGVSQVDDGLNFAIFSQHASSVTLCLKLPERGTQDDADIIEFALDRQKNKTGDIWHVSVE